MTLLNVARALPGTPGIGAPVSRVEGLLKNPRAEGGPSFADTLKGYLDEVRALEEEAGRQVTGLAEGSTTEVHEVMMAVEEANLALDLLIEIRNRLLETYQQLTRTSL